jgi:uncharacterized membrane protein
MLSDYLLVKLVHIVSATVLFGTGLGTAFFMFCAHRSANVEAIRTTSRHVVLADWIFTLPAVVIQFVTGLWLTNYLQIPWTSVWLITAVIMFAVVGLCWLPVVYIQIRISRISATDLRGSRASEYSALMKIWIALGVPAFLLTLMLFALMVLKWGL